MKTATQPIKRSPQLAPLSREHHDGLLFSWKLRQGIKKQIATEVLREFCHWYWLNHMKDHFAQEENILLPYLDKNDRHALRLKKEHDDIRDLLIAADRDPDYLVIELLASVTDSHIRFEERILFPYIEKILTPDDLNTIYQQLDKEHTCTTEWKNEFWLRDATDQKS